MEKGNEELPNNIYQKREKLPVVQLRHHIPEPSTKDNKFHVPKQNG